MTKVPAIGAQEQDINNLVSSTGFQVPSDFFNQWLVEIYGDQVDTVLEVFGCDNNADGTPRDCQDILDRYLTARHCSKIGHSNLKIC